MRVLVDLTSHVTALTGSLPDADQNGRLGSQLGVSGITQVEKDADLYVPVPMNGKYVLPVPEGLTVLIDKTSKVLPIDGTDISSKAYAELLARYPMYEHIYFNPLLTVENLGEIDPLKNFRDNSTSPPTMFPNRFQTGRNEPTHPQNGNAPNSTALMPVNGSLTPPRPGMMVTEEIDITPYTGEAGTDEFMVYWRLYAFDTSHDISGGLYGKQAGVNEPAIRSIIEIVQEPSGFTAYLTIDDGVNWFEVGRLEPIAFCCKAHKVRLAFRNDSPTKIHVASFAFMF